MANIDLLLGRWRVGVRSDSDSTRRRLLGLLKPYVDSSGEPTRNNFSVRVESDRGSGHEDARLYVGGELVLDGVSLDVVTKRLVGHLAGVAADLESEPAPPPGGGHTSVDARLAVHGDRAVLVFSRCTGGLDVPDADIGELAVWHPRIESASGSIVPPPALEGLRWRRSQMSAPPCPPHRLEVVGVVAPLALDDRRDLVSVWLAGHGDLDGWGLLLAGLDQAGRVASAQTADELELELRRLLA